MKKITKRIMAFMLSLVMVFGCVPSFINEASAADKPPHIITIKNVFDGALKSDVVVEYDGAIIGTVWTNSTDNYLHANQTYSFTFMTSNVSVGDTCKIVIDASSNIELTSDFESGNGTDSNTYNIPMASIIRGKIEFTVLGPKTTPIMTAASEGQDTGLTLTGPREAVYGTDYDVVLDDENTINIATSGWKLEGKLNSGIFENGEVDILVDSDDDMCLTIGDLDENDQIIRLQLRSETDIKVIIDITKPIKITQLEFYQAAGAPKAHLLLNSDNEFNVDKLHFSITNDAEIIGPGIINTSIEFYNTSSKLTIDNATINAKTKERSDIGIPIYSMADIDVTNQSKLISINDLEGEGSYGLCMMGSLNVDDTSECFSSGNMMAICGIMQPAITDITPWKCSGEVVPYNSKNSLTESMDVIEDDMQYFSVIKDSDPLIPAKTAYKKVKQIYTEGSITASPLTAGTKVKDINLTLDFGDNVFTENYCYAVFDNSVGPEGKLLNDDDSLEAGKTYQLLVVLAMDDVDNYETVIFNGETLAEEENYLIDSQGKELSAWIELTLEPAPTSGGSSKTYKATDTKNTAEKISGSSKKGSKRTITPIEGKKVGKVTVTDKNGNKINVTMNADGTYSFIQPASDVNVEVTYSNREITLNIGSTEASVDGERENLDVCPVIRNDRTMLPIRFVAENLGAKVDWDEKDPNYVVITRGDTKIEITLGSDKMLVNGKDVKLDSVAFAENDRTYLPVRAISEALNAIVEWNENEPSVVRIYEQQ